MAFTETDTESFLANHTTPPAVPEHHKKWAWKTFFALSELILVSIVASLIPWAGLLKFMVLLITLVLPFALGGSAWLTYRAATAFGERAESIKAVLETQRAGTTELSLGDPPVIDSRTDLEEALEGEIAEDSLQVTCGHQEAEVNFTVFAGGAYLPNPYQSMEMRIRFTYKSYISLINAETASARKEAAKLAGILSGSFVAGILTLGRLTALIQILTPHVTKLPN